MKKTGLFYVIATLLVTSCIQENLDGGGNSKPDSFLPDEIKAVAPKKSIGADVEVEDMKSMTPDGTKVYWENGDQITLFTGAEDEAGRRRHAIYTAIIEDGPKSVATFRRDQNIWPYRDGDHYLAAYPASSIDRWGSNTNWTAYAILPTEQTARQGAWDPAAGILAASSRTPDFVFDHAVAYVKFTVNGSSSPFVSMHVAYPDVSTYPMGSDAHVNAAVANQLTIHYAENSITVSDYKASTSVVVKDYDLVPYPSTKAVLNSPDEQPFADGTYYVAVMPREYTSGLSCVFTAADGKVAVMKLNGPINLARGEVFDVGTIGSLTFKTPIQNHTIWSDANGENQGVVFWVDDADPTKGKIVSICNHVRSCWSTILEPMNVENPDAYLSNYTKIVNSSVFSAEAFPAVAFCQELRKRDNVKWHLPTIQDMRILYNSYYGRNYISPLRGQYSLKDANGNTIVQKGLDFRYRPDNMTNKDYQKVLQTKKNFDDLLESIGEPSPASLDGTNVIGTSGNYSIDPNSLLDEFGMNTSGANQGINYWLHCETPNTDGKNAYTVRIGHYAYTNGSKSDRNNKYIRCIREVSLE